MSKQCEICGKQFDSKAWNQKFCSIAHKRLRERRARMKRCGFAAAGLSDKGEAAKSQDGFAQLRGDALLSDWKPHVTLDTNIPNIPEFLLRR